MTGIKKLFLLASKTVIISLPDFEDQDAQNNNISACFVRV
jgi:hypothetical protein